MELKKSLTMTMPFITIEANDKGEGVMSFPKNKSSAIVDSSIVILLITKRRW